jgi:Tol biopolymer transport system component
VIDSIAGAVGWSPDRRHLAFVRNDATFSQDTLVVADSDGGNERVLVRRRLPESFFTIANGAAPLNRPAWSADGRQIALLGFDKATYHVVVADVNTGSERRLMVPLQVGGSVAWLGEASLLVNGMAAGTGLPQIWRLSYPDGALSRITNDLSEYSGTSTTEDASMVVTSRSETRAGIWIGDGIRMKRHLRPWSGRRARISGSSRWTARRPASLRISPTVP